VGVDIELEPVDVAFELVEVAAAVVADEDDDWSEELASDSEV